MIKIVRNVRSADAPAHRQRLTRDTLLPSAITQGAPPKVCALGSTWRGDLRPLVDAALDTLEPLLSSYGPSPEVLNLGKTWIGGMTAQISRAAREAAGAQDDTVVDVSEVMAAATGLNAELIGGNPSSVRINDALRRVRSAVARTGGRTADANPLKRLTQLTPDQLLSGANSPENRRAREFWDRQSAPVTPGRPIGDSGPTTAVRDGLHAVNQARSTAEQNARANDLARAFWARA